MTARNTAKTLAQRLLHVAAVSMPCLFLTGCALFHGPSFDPRAEAKNEPNDAAFTAATMHDAIKPEWLKTPTKEYTLGPGDKLDIEVLGEADTHADAVITPDGKLYYSLVPGLDVNGRTVEEVRKELESELTKLYRHPQVVVTLTDAVSQRIWVLGRLYSPGIYPLKRPMRVLDAISLAGGLFASALGGTTEELADLSHSFLKRNGQLMPIDFQRLIRDGDLAHNIYLEPNDYIYLPSSLSSEIYVMGAVVQPRSVGFMNEMNILSAIGHVAGATPGADLEHVTIVRGSLTKPKYAVVNVRAIAAGRATNFRLQPGDIVYVPEPGQFSLERYVRLATQTFVQIVGATEGGHAVGRGNSVNIGITPDGKVTPVLPATTTSTTPAKTTLATSQTTPQ